VTVIDKVIRRWRESKVRRYLHPRARVLDIGCGDGSLFRRFQGSFESGVGIDPRLAGNIEGSRVRLIAGSFPEQLEDESAFDVVTLLAVLEHVPEQYQPRFAEALAARLKKDGLLIITVPSPSVDQILYALRGLRLIEGIALEEHYGFPPERTLDIFGAAGLQFVRHDRFQLGLNHLFVFRKL
jgi:2-polyprenyl-3-methyl-5-hydroxy-6-metoxy-1,4-benzoquinol methylase